MYRFLKVFLKMSLFHGIAMYLIHILFYGTLWKSSVERILIPVLFGFFMAILDNVQTSKLINNYQLLPDETLLSQNYANRIIEGKKVHGWIYLTSLRLVFKPSKTKLSDKEFSIPISEISYVTKESSLPVIPGKVLIMKNGGEIETLLAPQANTWVKELNKLI